jgi:uncharacterized protein
MGVALLAAVVLLAFVVEAAAGFGGTVVTVSLASHAMPVGDVLARFIPVNVALSLYMVVRHRAHVSGKLLFGRILPFMGVGVVAGFFTARAASPTWLKVVFGAFVSVLSVLELRALRGGRRSGEPLPGVVAAAALMGAGVLHGLFACGGPLAVWVVGREVSDKGAFRATLSALWLVLNIALVVGFAIDHKVTASTLRESAILVPALVLGIAVGERVHDRLSAERFRVAVFSLLLVASLVLLARSLA